MSEFFSTTRTLSQILADPSADKDNEVIRALRRDWSFDSDGNTIEGEEEDTEKGKGEVESPREVLITEGDVERLLAEARAAEEEEEEVEEEVVEEGGEEGEEKQGDEGNEVVESEEVMQERVNSGCKIDKGVLERSESCDKEEFSVVPEKKELSFGDWDWDPIIARKVEEGVFEGEREYFRVEDEESKGREGSGGGRRGRVARKMKKKMGRFWWRRVEAGSREYWRRPEFRDFVKLLLPCFH